MLVNLYFNITEICHPILIYEYYQVNWLDDTKQAEHKTATNMVHQDTPEIQELNKSLALPFCTKETPSVLLIAIANSAYQMSLVPFNLA